MMIEGKGGKEEIADREGFVVEVGRASRLGVERDVLL